MANIHSLPTEVLDLIFHQLLPGETLEASSEVEPKPSRSIFPLNVACVCMRWLKILLSRRLFWKQTVIDVATDPTPFLSVFALIKGVDDEQIMTFDLIVFSSLNRADWQLLRGFDDKEKARTDMVFRELRASGAISLCQSITFDLIYQWALPCAATMMIQYLPFLKKLWLKAAIDQTELDEREIDIDIEAISNTVSRSTYFPHLKKITLTGYSFMQMCSLGRGWLKSFRTASKMGTTLSVDLFMFCVPDASGWETSIPFLLDSLEAISGEFDVIKFSNFRLDHYPTKSDPRVHELRMNKLILEKVTANFITAFFYNTAITEAVTLTFKNCYIPDLGRDIRGYRILGISLELIDIPQPSTDRYDSLNGSLYHAVSAFPSTNLYISNCPDSMEYKFIRWLAGYPGLEVERPYLSAIVFDGWYSHVEHLMILIDEYEKAKGEGYHADLSSVHLILGPQPCEKLTQWIDEHDNEGSNSITVTYTVSDKGANTGDSGQ